MRTATAVNAAKIPDGACVEHTEWTDGTYKPQRGTVIVRLDGSREIAWHGTTAYNPLTPDLAAKLVRIS